MEKKKNINNNFIIKFIDIIILPIILITFFMSSIFQYNYNSKKEYFNLELTNVDYIIQTPTQKQVEEISELDHVDSIVPYLYKSVDININSKNINSDLFIINSVEDLDNTLFCDELLLSSSSNKINQIFIDEKLSNKNKLNLNDQIKINLYNKNITFTITKIYKNDGRHSNGFLMTTIDDDIKTLINNQYGNNIKWSGAYISSNDKSKTNLFLDNFKPEGNKLTRDDFTSDDLYNTYLDQFNTTKFSRDFLYKDKYIKEQHNKYDISMNLNFIASIIMPFISIIAFCLYLFFRINKYIKNDVQKDKKNNFTYTQEKGMFNKWILIETLFYLSISIIIMIIGFFAFKLNILSIQNIIMILCSLLFIIVLYFILMKKLKSFYN